MDQPREPARIQCLECGRWMRALPSHLRHAHQMADEDYRLKYLIPVGTPLVCLEWSDNQSRRNVEEGLGQHLSARGPAAGYEQRESVRVRRRPHYTSLAAQGTASAATHDKTAERRERLRPYPVTAAEASERLGCTMSAAYNFLSYCVATGRLVRIGRGRYGETT